MKNRIWIMSENFEDIVETFEFLDAWEDRYRHVIEMGRAMPALDDALKTSATKVNGCASQVWLVPKIHGIGPDAVLDFDGASDAMIVQGLIAILKVLFAGQTVKQALEIDAIAAFARLGLDQHLSAQRSNGLRAMIERLRAFSKAASLGSK
ncbi:MAG: SufE family protein [Rhodobacterales bacterium]